MEFAVMKTHDYRASECTSNIVSAEKILKNHRQFQTDISNNIQHWLSIINFNAQSIMSKNYNATDFADTEKLVLQILDACIDLENFHKSVFGNN